MKRLPLIVAALTILGYFSTSLYTVSETEFGLETRFSQITETVREPGLHIKWPWPAGQALKVNRRARVLDLDQREYLTRDKKNIVVSAYVLWRVEDPEQFWKTLRNDPVRADARIGDRLGSDLGVALGREPFHSLISTDASQIRFDAILDEVSQSCRETETAYGIKVLDVRLKRLNFPEVNRVSVFRRMESERRRIAVQFRSEGEEEAAKIRAAAEKERQNLLSDAERQAKQLRGEGEAEAARILSDAVKADPEFYVFLRKLEAYDAVIDKDTTLIIPDTAPFLDVFFKGAAEIPGTTARSTR